MKTYILAILTAIILAITHQAQATSLAVDFTAPGSSNSSSYWSLGYQFKANQAVTVLALGTYDYGQNGFSSPQQVGLWDSNQNLIASTLVDNSDPLTGFWRFNSIAPVTLVAGGTYFVASQGGEGYTFNTSGLTVDSRITYIQDAFSYTGNSNNSPLTFPNMTDSFGFGAGGGFFGGNLELGSGSAPVPEPGTMALLGLGMAGLAIYGKRRQNKA